MTESILSCLALRTAAVSVAFVLSAPLALAQLGVPGPCGPGWTPGVFADGPGGPSIPYAWLDSVSLGGQPTLFAFGPFWRIGLVASFGIARHDGHTWRSVPLNPAGSISALASFNDGTGERLVAGGSFTKLASVSALRIAQWDGTTVEPLGAGMDGNVTCLATGRDAGGPALFVGGAFSTAGEVSAARIARWNGQDWAALADGLDGPPYAMAWGDVGDGPSLYAAGKFSKSGEVGLASIGRWSQGAWHPMGAGLNASPSAMLIADLGDGPALYVAGDFSMAGETAAKHVARWKDDTWSALGVPPGDDCHKLAVHDEGDGPRLCAMTRDHSSGDLSSIVIRWDGTQWTALGEFVGEGKGIASMPTADGPRLFASTLSLFPTTPRIRSWGGNQWRDEPQTGGLSLPYTCARIRRLSGDAEALYFPGWRVLPQGAPSVPQLRRLEDGTMSDIPIPFTGHALDCIRIDLGEGPELVVGGRFETSPGAHQGVLRLLDGVWQPLNATIGSAASVWALGILPAIDGGPGSLVAAGSFTSLGGAAAKHVARWNGATWEPMGAGLPFRGDDLIVFDAGDGPSLHVGHRPADDEYPAVDRWDGTAWVPAGPALPLWSAPSGPFRLFVLDAGDGPKLYVASGSCGLQGYVLRLDEAEGQPLWTQMGQYLTSSVRGLEVHDDGSGPRLYAGGEFTFLEDQPFRGGIAALVDGEWQPLGLGVDYWQAPNSCWRGVQGLASLGDGGLLLAGDFDNALDAPVVGVAADGLAIWGRTGQPVGVLDPESRTIPIGSALTLAADAAAWPEEVDVVHRWMRDGVPLADDDRISGASAPLLTIASVQARDAGAYSLHSTTQCGETTSAAAIVTITCAGDLSLDGAIDGSDLGALLAAWGTGSGDVTGDGTTSEADLAVLLSAWGACGG